MQVSRLIYTVCFIVHKQKVLLLNRQSSPNMGLWNGVGGKIEHGESAYHSVIREVREETGIELEQVQFGGIVTWTGSDGSKEGLYLFWSEISDGQETAIVRDTDEGIVAWKELRWVLHPDNLGVASNIAVFLPKILDGITPCEFFCTYENSHLTNCELIPLAPHIDPLKVERIKTTLPL